MCFLLKCAWLQLKNKLSTFRLCQTIMHLYLCSSGLPSLNKYYWAVVIFTAIRAQRGNAPFNVNSLTSPQPQPTPSTSRCPLLPVSLSGPWQTLWSGLLSAARMFVCSLSHLVAWHAAQCAPSPSVYPAWRREIKQKNCHEDCSRRRGSHHWRNLSALPRGEERRGEERLFECHTHKKKLCLATVCRWYSSHRCAS